MPHQFEFNEIQLNYYYNKLLENEDLVANGKKPISFMETPFIKLRPYQRRNLLKLLIKKRTSNSNGAVTYLETGTITTRKIPEILHFKKSGIKSSSEEDLFPKKDSDLEFYEIIKQYICKALVEKSEDIKLTNFGFCMEESKSAPMFHGLIDLILYQKKHLKSSVKAVQPRKFSDRGLTNEEISSRIEKYIVDLFDNLKLYFKNNFFVSLEPPLAKNQAKSYFSLIKKDIPNVTLNTPLGSSIFNKSMTPSMLQAPSKLFLLKKFRAYAEIFI